MTRKLLIPALFGLAVLATACGGATSSAPTPAQPAAKSAPVVPAPVAATPVAAAPGPPTLVMQITHATKGCHTWSLNGGPSRAAQKIQVPVGSTLKVVDNDVMPHNLVQIGGPAVSISGAEMAAMSAASTVTFSKPGVYKFTTKAGEDYPDANVGATVGEDNVLKLRVVVA
jgi:hypothetical protein